MKGILLVWFFPRGLWLARNGAEASEGEPQRSAAAAKAGADAVLASRPDSEVVAKPKRRTFTAEYKQRILQEAEAAAGHTRRPWRTAAPRRAVLVAAGLLGGASGPMASCEA